MAGPSGLTTEAFISKVAWRLGRYVAAEVDEVAPRDLLCLHSNSEETVRTFFVQFVCAL